MVYVYLLMGLAFVGAMLFLLQQITVRQQRVSAEMARLEQLAADVAMTTEAVLDRIEQRGERLKALADRIEAQAQQVEAEKQTAPGVKEEAAAPTPEAPKAEAQKPDAPAAPVEAPTKRKRTTRAKSSEKVETPAPKRQRKPKAPAAGDEKASAAARTAAVEEAPADHDRQDEVRRVLELTGKGKSAPQIAEVLGIPRGEVELIRNLHQSAT